VPSVTRKEPAPEYHRITVGEHWVDLRKVEDLTWADQEAWDDAFDDAVTAAREAAYDPETGQRRNILSDDGVTMVPVSPRPKITPDMVRKRRDDLLTSLIAAWSFDLPLPFTPEVRKEIPRAVGAALAKALDPYVEAFSDPGPKETTEPSSDSGSS